MLAAGTAVAAAEAWLVFSRLRPTTRRFVAGEIFWAIVMEGLCVSGGVVAAWLAGLLLPKQQPGETALVCKNTAVGWAFLPCIAMMAQRGSWWVFPIAALATVAAVFRLRPLFRNGTEEGKPSVQAASEGLPSLYGLGVPETPPPRSFVVAGCAQVSVAFAVRGWLGVASAGLCVCLALSLVWWAARDGKWERVWAGRRRAAQLYAVAVALTLLLTPWIAGGAGGSNVAAAGSAKGASREGEPGHNGIDYVGIVLWPPQKKKVDIVPPRANTPVAGHGIGSKLLVIPFDGPYWYFKDPELEPGPKAHVTFGEPTEAKVRSKDWMPLRMQAHQNLGLPIDLDCCREIDVTVTNADLRVGTILVSVVLTDTSSAKRKTTTVGVQPVVSSELGAAGGRGKVTETLKFAVPASASAKLRQFDQIDVVIQPTMERARLGSRVSIDQFELVPK
jgi:hypothetical protein